MAQPAQNGRHWRVIPKAHNISLNLQTELHVELRSLRAFVEGQIC